MTADSRHAQYNFYLLSNIRLPKCVAQHFDHNFYRWGFFFYMKLMSLPILVICWTTYSQNAFVGDIGNFINVKNG